MKNVKKRKTSGLTRRQQRAGLLFLLPWIIGFLLFFLKPMVESFWFSLCNVTVEDSGISTVFAGLQNYRQIILDDSFFVMNLFSVSLSIVEQVIVCTSVSLLIAVVLVSNFRGRTVFRAIFFLPIVLTSGVVYSMIGVVVDGLGLGNATNAYMASTVSASTLMIQAGLDSGVVGLLEKMASATFSMILNCGVPILLYISALQKIPSSTYEAAILDGASKWDCFWKITIPKIAPIIFLNMVYVIVDASTSFGRRTVDGISINLTDAVSNGKLRGGNLVLDAMMDLGFRKSMKFGPSAAMAWMYFLVIALFLLISWLLVGRTASKIEN